MKLYDLVRQLVEDGITIEARIEIRRSERPGDHAVKCQYCGWASSYSTRDSATRGLRAHYQHCSEYARAMQWSAGANGLESHDS